MIGKPNTRRKTGPRRGRPPRVDRAAIVAAAVAAVVDSDMEHITMRSVAERVGVSEMAVYRHVANRQDLVESAADAVLGFVAVPAELVELTATASDAVRTTVAEGLHRLGTDLIDVLAAHPGVAEHLAIHGPSGPAGLGLLGCIVRALSLAGVPDELVPSAHGLYTSAICSVATVRSRVERANPPAWGAAAATVLDDMTSDPVIARVLPHFTGQTDHYQSYVLSRVIEAVLSDIDP